MLQSLNLLAKLAIVAGLINIILWIPSLTLVFPNYLSGGEGANIKGSNLQSLARQGVVELEATAPVMAVVWSTISLVAFTLMTTYGVSVRKIVISTTSSALSKQNDVSYNSIFGSHRVFYAILTGIGIVIIIFGSVSIGLVLREIAIYSSGDVGIGQVVAAISLYELSEQGYLQSTTLSSWISDLVNTVTTWIANYGYPAVFAAALLETVFPPIPSEVVFPLAGFTAYDKQLGLENAIGMASAGALGSTVGAVAIYYASLKVGKAAIIRYGKYVRIGKKEIEKADKWFEKHGELAVFLGRMAPGVREIISIPAGISKMNITKFIIFTFAGSLVWSIMLSLAGYYGGQAWNEVSERLSSIFGIVGAIIVAGIIAFIVIKWLKGRRSASQR